MNPYFDSINRLYKNGKISSEAIYQKWVLQYNKIEHDEFKQIVGIDEYIKIVGIPEDQEEHPPESPPEENE